MSYIIAVAGKGGTGKTTISALTVRLIKKNKLGSCLAVDADPNSNLGEVLGLQVKETVGQILDRIARNPADIPGGMTKDRFIEYEVQSAVEEGEGFDLLTMGKPEGPGCYCYVNNVLRQVMGKLVNDYDYVIIDNEAGLEHLSRRTTRQADTLLVISDATPVGLRAAQRINGLAHELEIKTKRNILIVNRHNENFAVANSLIEATRLEYIGSIPPDKEIEKASLNGNSMMSINNDAVSIQKLAKLGDKLWN